MKLIVDWEYCMHMFSCIDILHQALLALGVGVEYCQIPNIHKFGFMKGGNVVGVVDQREVVVGSRYAPDVEDQQRLSLDEDFLCIHGRSLLEKAIPIYAEWDFSLGYPDEEFPADPTDPIRRKYLKNAAIALCELFDRPA